MYQQLSAYAAALIRDPSRFTAAVQGDNVVWGFDKAGGAAYSADTMHIMSILGAMRAAYEVFGADQRAYNTLDKRVREYAGRLYGCDIKSLSHQQAVGVLKAVAKG